jgi:hypothetical protein
LYEFAFLTTIFFFTENFSDHGEVWNSVQFLEGLRSQSGRGGGWGKPAQESLAVIRLGDFDFEFEYIGKF